MRNSQISIYTHDHHGENTSISVNVIENTGKGAYRLSKNPVFNPRRHGVKWQRKYEQIVSYGEVQDKARCHGSDSGRAGYDDDSYCVTDNTDHERYQIQHHADDLQFPLRLHQKRINAFKREIERERILFCDICRVVHSIHDEKWPSKRDLLTITSLVGLISYLQGRSISEIINNKACINS